MGNRPPCICRPPVFRTVKRRMRIQDLLAGPTRSVESRRLSDEAAQSPIVERRSGIYANAGIAYRF